MKTSTIIGISVGTLAAGVLAVVIFAPPDTPTTRRRKKKKDGRGQPPAQGLPASDQGSPASTSSPSGFLSPVGRAGMATSDYVLNFGPVPTSTSLQHVTPGLVSTPIDSTSIMSSVQQTSADGVPGIPPLRGFHAFGFRNFNTSPFLHFR